MINNTIAKRYAKALCQLGSETGSVDTFSLELQKIQRLFSDNAELRAAFGNPAFTVEQKREIMKGIIERAGCSQLVANFLLLLVDKNRVTFLPQIIQTYSRLADEQAGVIRPVIRTAFPMEAAQLASITAVLEKKTGKNVYPSTVVEKELLGGIVTQIGDTAYDSSVKTQLKRIQDILQKG